MLILTTTLQSIHPFSVLFFLTLILSLFNCFCCFSSSLTGYGGAAGGGGGNVATAGQGGGGASRGGPVSQVRNVIVSSRLLPILLTFLTSFLRSYLLFFLLTFLVPLLPSYLPHFLPSPLPSVYLTDLPYPSCHDESLFYSTSHSLISITPNFLTAP